LTELYVAYIVTPVTPSDLRRLRHRIGLSQSGFAALVGVTSNTVARWERGELGMRATTQRLLGLIAAQSPQKTKRKKEA